MSFRVKGKRSFLSHQVAAIGISSNRSRSLPAGLVESGERLDLIADLPRWEGRSAGLTQAFCQGTPGGFLFWRLLVTRSLSREYIRRGGFPSNFWRRSLVSKTYQAELDDLQARYRFEDRKRK